MEFVFTGKHATGEFSVLQVPFDRPARQEDDLIGNVKAAEEVVNLDIDPSQHYDSDTLLEYDSPNSVGSKRKPEQKEKKGKWPKQADENMRWFMKLLVPCRLCQKTMRFTHVTDPNESIYKAIDAMEEYPLLDLVHLGLQTYLAENRHIASMLEGRPAEAVKQWVARWVLDHYPV